MGSVSGVCLHHLDKLDQMDPRDQLDLGDQVDQVDQGEIWEIIHHLLHHHDISSSSRVGIILGLERLVMEVINSSSSRLDRVEITSRLGKLIRG